MSHPHNGNPVIDVNSFKKYWLRKLDSISGNENRLSEIECVRLKKRIHLMLQRLNEIEERDAQFLKKLSSGV